MIEEYQSKKQELDEKFEREKSLLQADGKELFKIERWVPKSNDDG